MSILTLKQRYVAGGLFAIAFHQAQVTHTRIFNSEKPSAERVIDRICSTNSIIEGAHLSSANFQILHLSTGSRKPVVQLKLRNILDLLLSEGLAGIQPVDVPGIENVDLTECIEGHSAFLWTSQHVLHHLALDTLSSVLKISPTKVNEAESPKT